MIPAGYMAKRVVRRPDWLKANGVEDIYSVSGCLSKDFADYIKFWKHNGYWFFDSPEVIEQVAREQSIDLAGTTMFFYEVYEQEFNDAKEQWYPYERDRSFITNVCLPEKKILAGFDVVSSTQRTALNALHFHATHWLTRFRPIHIACFPILRPQSSLSKRDGSRIQSLALQNLCGIHPRLEASRPPFYSVRR